MKLLVSVIAICCGSWMTIYLYGLYAIQSVKYDHILILFPAIMFSIVLYCLYSEIKRIEKANEERSIRKTGA